MGLQKSVRDFCRRRRDKGELLNVVHPVDGGLIEQERSAAHAVLQLLHGVAADNRAAGDLVAGQ